MDILEIGSVFRRRREQLQLTQKELAQRSSVHLRSINNVEGGLSNPSLDTLYKLAETLRLEIIVRTKL